MLCDSLVLSYFNYFDVIYSQYLDLNDKNRIQKVQNSCLILIFGHISHKLCVVK